MKNASTFGFVERSRDSNHLPLPEFGEVGFEATGNYQSPDRFTKRVLVRELGHLPAIHMRSISIGDERYAVDPATEEWMLFHDDLGKARMRPFLRFSPLGSCVRPFSVAHFPVGH